MDLLPSAASLRLKITEHYIKKKKKKEKSYALVLKIECHFYLQTLAGVEQRKKKNLVFQDSKCGRDRK